MKQKLVVNRVQDDYALYSKVFQIMKLTVFLMLFCVFQVFAESTYSQSTKLSLAFSNAKVKDVLNEIESNSDYYFLYNGRLVDVERKVSLNVSKKGIDEILDMLFDGADVGYTILDRQIIIQSDNSDTNPTTFFQERTISGTVTNESGEPIPGATVVVKGTTSGTITDMDGNYVITVGNDVQTLVFSFVGMNTKEVEIGGQSTINVSMEPATIGLDEVVAIGYGTQKKATITGSVSSVQGEDLKQSPAVNFTNALTGRLPGLVSVQRSGEPGYDNSTLRIRGSNTLNDNSPLVVVDGIAGREMARLDPADIESVTILKDASAAIYGAQAANGVILITTKRGKAGKPEITVNVNQGVSQPTRVPEMATAAQYAEMINEINIYRDREPRYTDEEIQKYRDGSDPWKYPNTDWFGEVFKDYTPQTYANVSMSGGSERMKYFLSIGGKHQDAFYENSATNYSQLDFRTNIDGEVSKNMTVSFDVAGRQENKNFPTRGAGDIFRMVMRGKPNLPAYWPDGTPGPDIEYGNNPVVIATDATGYDKDKRYILESNIRLKLDVPWIKGLSLTGNVAVDKIFRNRKVWQTPWYLYSWDFESYDENGDPELIKGQRGYSEPRLSQYMEDHQRITMNALINYDTTIGEDHELKFLFGAERFTGNLSQFEAFRRYFVSAAIDELFAGGDLEKNNTGSSEETARFNYFGRVNYLLKSKYLAEFVWRYDGSYIFPEDNRFGFFPGVSLGWRISEENFWKSSLPFIENFKIRGSWGQTGNDRVGEYQFLTTYGFNENNRTYIFNTTEQNKILRELRIPNPDITWEIANQTNVGFDGQTMNGRLYFEADYFYNLRTNILVARNASVPTSTGLELPDENIGEVVNQGFEYLFRFNDRFGELDFGLTVSGGYQKNKIQFWDETPGIPDYQQSTGHPMDTELYYRAIGIFDDEADVESYPHWANAQPGDIIFEDVNDDGVIDGLDRVRIDKNTIPRFTGGVSLDLGYKNFDLSLLFQGAAGAINYIDTESGEIGNFLKEFADNRWTPDNTDATYPRTFNRDEEYWASQRNTFWMRSTDYVRLKNLEFGYSIPSRIRQKLGFSGMRIYLSGLNLLTWDKIKIYDPESDSASGQVYPLNKTYNVGVTLTF